jgi:ligand-binding SRPBCC domain-containing protein
MEDASLSFCIGYRETVVRQYVWRKTQRETPARPMVNIRSMTLVDAPVERCFRLALNIDLQSLATKEQPIDGVTSGGIGLGETVTWQRQSFGRGQRCQTLIEQSRPPIFFREIMISPWLKGFEHDRHFAVMNDGTRIRDEIRFTAPMGLLGLIAERLFLRRMILRRLQLRNAMIKRVAESDEWKTYLTGQPQIRVVQSAGSASNSSEESQSNVA